jgi:hypothetical protein
MNDGPNIGWLLVVSGLILVGVGLVFVFGSGIGIGRLPGDIQIERGNTRFYFPIVSCLVLSAALSLVLWLLRFFMRCG